MRVACLEAQTLEVGLGGVLVLVLVGVGCVIAFPLGDELCNQRIE